MQDAGCAVADAFRVPDSEWLPDEWVMKSCRFLQVTVLVGGIITLFWCGAQTKAWWGVPLALVVYFVSGFLHEAGHAVAALLGGATITRAQVGSIEIVPLRDGVRMRWNRAAREFGGLVQSFPSTKRSLRRQMVATIAAGPVVNAVIAVAALLAAHGRLDTAPGVMLLGIAAFNAASTIANLLPWASSAMLASDGLQLLRWLRGIDEKDPQLALVVLTSRLISGERSGEWVDDYLRVLEHTSQPGPLLVLWSRLRMAQVQGDWALVEELMGQVELQIVGLSPQMAKALERLIAVIRCEAAFSRAMAGHALERSPVEILGPDMGWHMPAVRLRCQALECLWHGHLDMARLRLAESERWSKRSVDRSLEHGESPLRDALAAAIDRAQREATQRIGAQVQMGNA